MNIPATQAVRILTLVQRVFKLAASKHEMLPALHEDMLTKVLNLIEKDLLGGKPADGPTPIIRPDATKKPPVPSKKRAVATKRKKT